MIKNAQRALQVIRIMGAITLAFNMEGHEEVKAHFDWLQEFDQLIAGLLGREHMMDEADIWAAARRLAEADGDEVKERRLADLEQTRRNMES